MLRRAAYLVGLTLVTLACQEKPAPLPDVDDPAQLLGGPTLAGASVDPTSLRGKVVVVNFWSPS